MRDARLSKAALLGAGARSLRSREFRLISKLVYEVAGIHLPDAKLALVEARLARRIRELGLSGYAEYCALVSDAANAGERVHMLDCITTNETHFFREPKHFDFLEKVAVPRWLELARSGAMPKRLRVWSAACSTGEEPYTLAMCLGAALPPESGWQIEVHGSDLSTRVLERAESATWSIDRAKEIPERYLKRFMLRGVDEHEGLLRCDAELRQMVRFSRINLHTPPYPLPGRFDLILCRNVLIYFDAVSRAKVIESLLERLSGPSYLMVGHSESLHGVTQQACAIAPGVYTRRGEGSSR